VAKPSIKILKLFAVNLFLIFIHPKTGAILKCCSLMGRIV
jgi:hypothetical protein